MYGGGGGGEGGGGVEGGWYNDIDLGIEAYM